MMRMVEDERAMMVELAAAVAGGVYVPRVGEVRVNVPTSGGLVIVGVGESERGREIGGPPSTAYATVCCSGAFWRVRPDATTVGAFALSQ